MPEYVHSFTPDDDAVNPEQVRILSLSIELMSEPTKVRVKIQLSPFTQLPDINFRILDASDTEVSSVNMIESVLNQINFVMHIRKNKESITGKYSLSAEVLYRDIGIVDQKTIQFEI
ncbi:MAG: hypothetical protein JEZ00_02460 [Anaerolineaceae bacterium]|nr:hypothetical protein [Anaerolineaceae bacterium]